MASDWIRSAIETINVDDRFFDSIQSILGWLLATLVMTVAGLLRWITQRRIAQVDDDIAEVKVIAEAAKQDVQDLKDITVTKDDLKQHRNEVTTQIDYVREEGRQGRDSLTKLIEAESQATRELIKATHGRRN